MDENEQRIRDPETLSRIRNLVIPPAWKDVWICPLPNGHIQAIGSDAAGRKQYLYHEDWRKRRDAEKFEHMLEFAAALPAMRDRCSSDLAIDGYPRARVLACAVRLLDRGFFRIGTEDYAEQNQTYGLATMQKRHVTVDGRIITFDYPAKSGQRRVQSLVDPEVLDVVRGLKSRRSGGPELLAYKDDRRWIDVKSSDINQYVKDITGGDFSAKDFRTWNATVLAAVALAVSGEAAKSRTARKRALSRSVQEVAHYLGNTPAVCRTSYIDPRVFDRYRSGWTISGALEQLGEDQDFGEPAMQGPIEAAVLDLLRNDKESEALEKIA
ncbi:MAG: DNA topoisomerase IB [Actinomycetota bacterium]|nr:DNA topoisomerase IB [Actinomycetota bacterium]